MKYVAGSYKIFNDVRKQFVKTCFTKHQLRFYTHNGVKHYEHIVTGYYRGSELYFAYNKTFQLYSIDGEIITREQFLNFLNKGEF